MTKIAQGLLRKRLAGFDRTGCGRVLKRFGMSEAEILTEMRQTRFLDGRPGSPDAKRTQDQLMGNHLDDALEDTVSGSVIAATLFIDLGANHQRTSDPNHKATVVIGADFFGGCQLNGHFGYSEKEQQNSLLHEMIHVITAGVDGDIFTTFKESGLTRDGGPTHPITVWLMRDCRN